MSFDPTLMMPDQIMAHKQADQDTHRLATWEQMLDALRLAELAIIHYPVTTIDDAFLAVIRALEAAEEEQP